MAACCSCQDGALDHEYASNTSLHGPGNIINAKRPAHRAVWVVLFLAAFGVAVWQISERFVAYFSYNTVTSVKVEFKDELDFPAVTICNFNKFQLSKVTPSELNYITEVLDLSTGFEGDDTGELGFDYDDYEEEGFGPEEDDYSLNVSAIPSNFDLADLTLNAGFVLDETTLQDCRWRGKRCYADNFTHAFTSYGNCWTFNSNDDKILRQTIPGSGNGLYLVIDVQQEQYTEKPPSGNSDAGLKFLVHPLAEPPKIDSQGTAVQPGTHAYASIQNILYKNEIPPWGTCDPTWRLDNYDTYTKTGCLLECRAEWVKKDCGCRTVSMPGNATYCSPTQLTQCVKTVVGKLADGRYPCECPTPCVANTFPTTVSYAAWPSISAQDYYTNLFNHTAEYLQRNFVVMDLYYAQLNYQEVIQTRQYTVGSFLGDFGGQLGLFLGASVITIAEFIEYIVMKVTQPCSSRGKRRTDTEMTSLGIDTKSNQSSPLS
ncbi:PREDICTED: acid-sensing ion channel 5-like [Branchiostoma belcheri]|uniref:Acid-sensing ion channel 5-like n=1 Tax=Branchiostoma belcheri TaxID=7741 RepID=A0A6P5AWE1_BRABE|nr:PREDICTED: acid-sensing ion channel 5-like [Branchiostoma belcheri]